MLMQVMTLDKSCPLYGAQFSHLQMKGMDKISEVLVNLQQPALDGGRGEKKALTCSVC